MIGLRNRLRGTQEIDPPSKLFNRNFLIQWQGQTVSRLGSQVFSIAMLFWIKDATGSAALMGALTMISSLPGILLGPVGGAFADRFSRRNIILFGDLIRGIAVMGLTAMIFFTPDAILPILIGLFAVSLINAVVSAAFGPAIGASIPDLVPKERVIAANSMGQLSLQISVFIGQGMGGILFRLLGAPVLFLINGLTFLYASFSEVFVTIPQQLPEKPPNWREQMRAFRDDLKVGLRFVWRRPGLRETVFVSAMMSFFISPIILLLPFYVEDILRVRVDWYGFILAAFGLGTLMGYLLTSALRLSPVARGRLIQVLIIANASGYVVLGLARSPWIALSMALMGGMASGFITVNITTLLQTTTPSAIRGRVFGLLTALSASLAPIAAGLAGVVADLTNHNIPAIYVVCGLTLVSVGLVASTNGSFRGFLASDYRTSEVPVEEVIGVGSSTPL